MWRRRLLELVVLVYGLLALVAQGAAASTITVTTGADSGAGSLRNAIASANPGDIITVPALTVTLTSGELTINKSLTITGAGARLTTITGSNLSRVFEITGGTVNISGVTVTGGNGTDTPGGTAGSGGGIDSSGILTLTDSTVTGNQVQGSNEGGGIQNDATLNVVRSTISFNSALTADRAGGIGDSGPISITDSTVAHNVLASGGLGAGLYVNNAGTGGVTLLNDNFDLNAAGPTGSSVDLNYENRPTTIANTIILGGTTGSCSRMPSANPSVGGNAEDQANCEFTQTGDHQNATIAMGQLQDNGGPTDTELPALASIPIDGGIDAYCPATDQRGIARPQGPHCDMGPVERTTPTAATPSVSGITTTAATLTSMVNPQNLGGSFIYSYGTTPAYGATTPAQTLGPGTASQPAVGTLSGLSPSTTYHVKITLTTPDGTASSTDVTFTTVALPPPPQHAPSITKAHLTHTRFRVGKQHTAISARAKKPPIGTAFVFTLSAAAKVQITIIRQVSGLRSGSRCVAPTTKLRKHHAKRCTRTITYGTLVRAHERSGVNQVAFSGRIGSVPLAPNGYRVLMLALNAGGRSKQVALSFTVVK